MTFPYLPGRIFRHSSVNPIQGDGETPMEEVWRFPIHLE